MIGYFESLHQTQLCTYRKKKKKVNCALSSSKFPIQLHNPLTKHALFFAKIQKMHRITYSKGRHEASFHPSVPSSIRPFVWSSICPVMVCLL